MKPEGEWTWEAEGVWTLTGRFVFSGKQLDDGIWHLELKTESPELQGELMFSEINGERIKVRKRSDTMQKPVLGPDSENTFVAIWSLTDVPVDPSEAEIRFILSDDKGNAILEMEWKGKESGFTAAAVDPVSGFGDSLRIASLALLILAGVTWIAAIIRALIIYQKRKTA